MQLRVSIKMGNKQGKLEERKDSKKNKSKNDKSNEQKTQDPRESVAPSAFPRNQKPELRVYQSFSGTDNGSHGIQHRGQSPVELKFYRRSASAAPTGGRYQSLPRNVGRNTNMGRSRSVTSSLNQSRDTLNREPVTDNAPFQRHSMIPPASNFLNESIRSSSTYASYRGANGYRAVADEFPDTSAIKRRLSQFETQFAKCFVALYSHLTETVQLSAVSIALRLGPTGQHPISLYQYLTSEDIPVDLASTQLGHSPNQPQYILTIPMQLFHGVKHIRNQRSADRRQWVSLARELVTCLAVEVADELSRIFEYQIVLVGDGLPIDLLARHAVECALDFLKSGNRFLDRNTLIAGVLSGGTRNQDPHTSKIMSIVIGERELKWNLSHVFRGCGLRKEMLLFSPKPQDSSRYCPWTFFTSPECNPQLYGYRGLAVERDPVHGFYVVSHDDEVRFTQKASHNPEEIHRSYAPFRRLIGKEVMDDYCSVTKEADNVTLADYVVKLQGTEYARDTIQPIYRPLGMVSALPYRTHRASSVSSLLSSDSGNRIVGRRPESALSRVNQHYPNVKQIQVNSTVIVRNGMTGTSTPIRNSSMTGTSTPIGNGQVYNRSQTLSYAQPRMVGGRVNSDACSTASADVGYGRGTRDVPTAFGTARFRNSSTYSRPESLQPRRLYQSQRQPTTRSASVFNPMPAHVAHEISAPTSTPTSDFIDFNSFLGMIKHADGKDGSGKVNGLASPADSVFSSRPTSPSGHSTVSKRGSVIVSQTTETWRVNGVYSADQPHYRAVERMHANNENDLRRTAISHV